MTRKLEFDRLLDELMGIPFGRRGRRRKQGTHWGKKGRPPLKEQKALEHANAVHGIRRMLVCSLHAAAKRYADEKKMSLNHILVCCRIADKLDPRDFDDWDRIDWDEIEAHQH